MRAHSKLRVSGAVQMTAALALIGAPAAALAATGGKVSTQPVAPPAALASAGNLAPASAADATVAHATRAHTRGAARSGRAQRRQRHGRQQRQDRDRQLIQRHARRPHVARVALRPALASWYYDAGATACGFHATYGIANKTLPCGTRVQIKYGSHTVTATVDDRGPYVAGRSFDLDQHTAQVLGMSGVAQVEVSA